MFGLPCLSGLMLASHVWLALSVWLNVGFTCAEHILWLSRCNIVMMMIPWGHFAYGLSIVSTDYLHIEEMKH